MQLFKNPLSELSEFQKLEENIENNIGPLKVYDVSDAQKPHLISVIGKRAWKLLITYDEIRARELARDISCFQEKVYLYPAKDILFSFADTKSHWITKERIEVWKHMASEAGGIIVTTIDALMDKLEAFDSFKANRIHIHKEDRIDLESLAKKLQDIGYERVFKVEAGGQFAIRGGIMDIFSLTGEVPIRMELWDDEIDSLRSFDIETQRSIEEVEEISLYPAREKELGNRASFLSYFSADESLIFIDEPVRTHERAVNLESELAEGLAGRKNMDLGEEAVEYFSANHIWKELDIPNTILLSGIGRSNQGFHVQAAFSLQARQISSYKNAFERLIEDLKNYQNQGYRAVLLSASKTRVERVASHLREYGLRAYTSEEEEAEVVKGQILVTYGNLSKGFEYPELKFCLISESDIYGTWRKKTSKGKKKHAGDRISALTELNIGDYIVHEEHGIGIYRGIEKIEKEDSIKDYIKLEYAKGAYCYIPASRLDLIQKYADSQVKMPKLHKLGGEDWKKTKARVKASIEEVAKDLVELYAKRLHGKGYTYAKDTVWQSEFEEMFPFTETNDQLKAIEDVKADMESTKIMDRLICGDVGYGKTEVAIRAAFKAVQEGKQVIYLVPTTILAQQHFNNFVQRMKDFPISIALLCRFRTQAEQKKSLAEFKRGLVDIIIGTHRVLSKDIEPKNLGLLIIDEEQRFGVAHKEKLKKLRENIDVLTLTATPIPRTLHMSLVGIRDLSVLEEAPMHRQAIQTYVMEYHEEIAREAIRRELLRGGQVYYVYNHVGDIARLAESVAKLLPEARVAFAHGQMKERELEGIMLDFINGEIDVLVSTTIIETGLDIANANTMIIHEADKLGLSQLYQLRGRVGRSAKTAYAFLFYKKGKVLSEEADKRLKAIREFTELGSGIKIAMKDLEIRGAGTVLGEVQHGHLQAIGYDLYCKLLHMAIKKVKGEDITDISFETAVEVSADAYIPSSYIGNEEIKLDIYKRIASIETKEDYMDMQDELIDRFGDLKREVENLLKISLIRAMAHRIYVEEVYINKQEIRLRLYEKPLLSTDRIPDFVDLYKDSLRIVSKDRVEFIYTERKKVYAIEEILDKTVDILEKAMEFLS